MMYYKPRLQFCLYIPLEIQLEIIKRIPAVKSLVRFRSVSKQWKSFIESSEFIASYGAQHTQPRHFLLFYKQVGNLDEHKCTYLVDEDNNTLTQQQGFVVMQQLYHPEVIGSSCGLLCMHNHNMIVLCNPSIRKSVCIVARSRYYISANCHRFGFGVCPVTNDPTIVKISYPGPFMDNRHIYKTPWHVEVFTLSSGVWNALPCSNMPRGSITLKSSQVVIDGFIYWVAYYNKIDMDVDSWEDYMIMSFDLIAKEFSVVDIPDSLKLDDTFFSISKLMESLVLFVCNEGLCEVCKMEHDDSFTKLFTISTHDDSIRRILGFRKNGELVMETEKEFEIGRENGSALEVYDSCSKGVKNLGIHGKEGSFFMSSYKETLLLLDHSDSCVYPVINDD